MVTHLLGTFENVLRELFLNEYELRRDEGEPSPVVGVLDKAQKEIDRDAVHLTGVEYYGTVDVRRD